MTARPIRRVLEAGEGPAIVLVHGWSADADFFAPQLALAEAGFHVLAPDLPGHGPEAPPDRTLDIADLSDSVAVWLAERRIERPLLVGWSMGAAVLLDLLARPGAPAAAGLAILDMSPKPANDRDWRHGLASGHDRAGMEAQTPAMAKDWSRLAPPIARALFAAGREPDPALLAFAERRMTSRDGPTMAKLWRSLAAFDGRAALDRIACPITTVGGGRSRVYGWALDAWYAARPGIARAFVLEDAGHALQLEAPARLNQILAACRATP